MDAMMEEGVRRKKRKQRKIRQKWIMRKRQTEDTASNSRRGSRDLSSVDLQQEEKKLALHVEEVLAPVHAHGNQRFICGQDLQEAQHLLREWMQANRGHQPGSFAFAHSSNHGFIRCTEEAKGDSTDVAETDTEIRTRAPSAAEASVILGQLAAKEEDVLGQEINLASRYSHTEQSESTLKSTCMQHS